MMRMLTWAGVGFGIGFLVLLALFYICMRRQVPDEGLFLVFSFMGAIPAAAFFALFAAVKIFQDEMRETRREMKHWQSIIQHIEEIDRPSTQFKLGPPSKRD